MTFRPAQPHLNIVLASASVGAVIGISYGPLGAVVGALSGPLLAYATLFLAAFVFSVVGKLLFPGKSWGRRRQRRAAKSRSKRTQDPRPQKAASRNELS